MFLIIARFLSVWSGTPFPINLVTSDSMMPSLMEGDVVAWTPTNIEDVNIGDVIVFKSFISWPDEKIVVHRVSNITHNKKGAILLETKGDKNEWTDQAGPHIPEPYVRDGNLLGKVISIGQQPLKIPFIGIFGIWINDGLDAISQPTASKESINYVGVFLPLTISAVILVVLIFILPEKARTIKEKLRLYILGPRPLNLKKTIATFLVGYILFLMLIHAFAYDSVSASVGINSQDQDASMEFGRIKPGTKSFVRALPVINPSIMPVKGVIFGRGNISQFITKEIFLLDRTEIQYIELKAVAPNNSINGSYVENIMVYSSPFWLMFPDNFIEGLIGWNGEWGVHILDILSGVILTFMTLFILVAITFAGDKLNIFLINRSWCHPAHLIFKKDTIKGFRAFRKRFKKAFLIKVAWTLKVSINTEEEPEILKKPIIASLAIVPVIFLITDQMLAMVISVIISGIIAYFISCKIRRKIVLTALITIIICTTFMTIQSNITIFGKEAEILELMSLSIGSIGIYLLLLTLFLIPLSLLTWKIASYFRNLKEQKDPLLSLEGTCDL